MLPLRPIHSIGALALVALVASCGDDDGAPTDAGNDARDAIALEASVDATARQDASSMDTGTDARALDDAAPFDDAAPPDDAAALDATALDATGPDGRPSDDASTLDAAPVTDAAPACPDPTGSGCSYVRITGTAQITEVATPPASEYACRNDPVRVVFTFAPNDAALAGCHVDPPATTYTFTIAAGAHPSRACATALGLTAGASVPAVRGEIADGTCTPVVFDWPTLDLDACIAMCTF